MLNPNQLDLVSHGVIPSKDFTISLLFDRLATEGLFQ
jgi:hypothetical protein